MREWTPARSDDHKSLFLTIMPNFHLALFSQIFFVSLCICVTGEREVLPNTQKYIGYLRTRVHIESYHHFLISIVVKHTGSGFKAQLCHFLDVNGNSLCIISLIYNEENISSRVVRKADRVHTLKIVPGKSARIISYYFHFLSNNQ